MAIVINGSGTVTGLAVGGLPDGTVDAGTVAADVATQAEIDAKLNLAGGTLTGDLLIHKQNPAITFKPTGANNAGKLMFKDENDDVKFTLGYQDSVSAFRLSSTDINQADYIHVKTDGAVGIGTETPSAKFEVEDGGTTIGNVLAKITLDDQSSHWGFEVANDTYSTTDANGFVIQPQNDGAVGLYNKTVLALTLNGDRGLSQFTAKAWARFSSTALNDSHNCSSFVDNGTGDYSINFSNNMTNANYCPVMSSHSNMFIGTQTNPAVGVIRMGNFNDHGNREDGDYFGLAVFGD